MNSLFLLRSLHRFRIAQHLLEYEKIVSGEDAFNVDCLEAMYYLAPSERPRTEQSVASTDRPVAEAEPPDTSEGQPVAGITPTTTVPERPPIEVKLEAPPPPKFAFPVPKVPPANTKQPPSRLVERGAERSGAASASANLQFPNQSRFLRLLLVG